MATFTWGISVADLLVAMLLQTQDHNLEVYKVESIGGVSIVLA
jgi:hypothetical protein